MAGWLARKAFNCVVYVAALPHSLSRAREKELLIPGLTASKTELEEDEGSLVNRNSR